jgi:hypothetical protein
MPFSTFSALNVEVDSQSQLGDPRQCSRRSHMYPRPIPSLYLTFI